MNKTMGQRIYELRKQKSLTQEQLAQSLGVTAQAVSKWENDQTCPDIAIIPELARILGISTDTLLGSMPCSEKPQDEGYVKASEDNSTDTDLHFEWQLRKIGVIFPIAVVIFGICLFLNNYFKLNIPVWNIIWPELLMVIGIGGMFRRISPLAIGLTALGGYYLLHFFGIVTVHASWQIVLPILIVLWGITMLIDKFIPKKNRARRISPKDAPRTYKFNQNDGNIHCEIAFGSEKCCVRDTHFRSGDMTVSFGEGVLDLTACQAIDENAVLKVNAAFGEAKIKLPPHIAVCQKNSQAFGEVTIKGAPDPDPKYTLLVESKVRFGEVKVEY